MVESLDPPMTNNEKFLSFKGQIDITPGSIKTTLIPNGSSSYDIDSLKPS